MFGLQNSTITAVYAAAAQTKDIYGTETLSTATAVSHRCWLEDTTGQQQQAGGDSHRKTAKMYTDYFSGLDEGNVITVVPDQIGNEPAQDSLKWRIENQKKGFSSSYQNSRIFRVELDLTQEVS